MKKFNNDASPFVTAPESESARVPYLARRLVKRRSTRGHFHCRDVADHDGAVQTAGDKKIRLVETEAKGLH